MVEKERKKQIKKLAKQEELFDEDVYDMEEMILVHVYQCGNLGLPYLYTA